jgi:hypothetical protein
VGDLVNRLVETALERGAHDNVTVVAVRRDKVRRQLLPRRRRRPAAAETAAAPRPWTSTEKVKSITRVAQSAASRPSFWDRLRRFFGALAVFVVLAVVAVLVYDARRVPHPPKSRAVSLADAVARGDRTIDDGPIELGGLLSADASLKAGSLRVAAEHSLTRLSDGVKVTLRDLRLDFPAGAATWEIEIGSGSRLVLRRVTLRAPELALAVTFADARGRLVFEDSDVDVAELKAHGPREARVQAIGGTFQTRRGRDSQLLERPD